MTSDDLLPSNGGHSALQCGRSSYWPWQRRSVSIEPIRELRSETRALCKSENSMIRRSASANVCIAVGNFAVLLMSAE
ncbi:MAG: hypothetical protein QXT42_02665 [Thermoplasmata archaeon]